jgi:hypothetical protein
MEAVPHSWIPHVRMGLSTALYRRCSLSTDIVGLLQSCQCIYFTFWLSCVLLVLMCFAHISLLSRCMTRYFILFLWGRSTLPICIVGQVWLRRVNVICVDLLWFILIPHFLGQWFILLMVASFHGDYRWVFMCCECIRCRSNVFAEPLPSNNSGIHI